LFGAISSEFVSPRNSTVAGGLLGMMQRSGAIGPSDRPDAPTSGLAGLLQEYLRNGREHGD
jgi:hypothetical protein